MAEGGICPAPWQAILCQAQTPSLGWTRPHGAGEQRVS